MIKVYEYRPVQSRSVLVFSFDPTSGNIVNNNLTVDMRKDFVEPNNFFQGFSLLEFESDQEEFLDLVVSGSSGPDLALYGQFEEIHLINSEKRHPVGVRCTREWSTPPDSEVVGFDIERRDRGGNPIGTIKFSFTLQPRPKMALVTRMPVDRFRPWTDRLPEFVSEPSSRVKDSFALRSRLPSPPATTPSVSFRLDQLPPPSGQFQQFLNQSANLYAQPTGPRLDVSYAASGTVNVGGSKVFFITAEDASQGHVQQIPFISWISDTPERGDLRIRRILPGDVDPPGMDRGSATSRGERMTIENVSNRIVNISGCWIEDEQRITFLGRPLPVDQPSRHVFPRRTRLQPGQTLTFRPDFQMNNDYDAFRLFNRAGQVIDQQLYIARLPGLPPPAIPRQRNVFSGFATLTPFDESVKIDLGFPLEDGDLVDIIPSGFVYAGELLGPLSPWHDPGGLPGVTWTGSDPLPLPAAPVFALLMEESPPRLIGNVPQSIVIDRRSRQRGGLRPGQKTVSFRRNDPYWARVFGAGAFLIIVNVFRH